MRRSIVSPALLVPALAALAPPPAEAACEVRAGAFDGPWKDAIAALDARVAAAPCKLVVVEKTPDGAVVIVTLPDGRAAARGVASPDELAPTVDGVLAGIAAASPTAAASSVAAAGSTAPPTSVAGSSAAVTSLPSPVPPVDPAAVAHGLAPSPSVVKMTIDFYSGFRAGGPGSYASPIFGLGAAIALDRWALGVYGQLESDYASPSLADSQHVSGWAAGVGVTHTLPLSLPLAAIFEAHVGFGVDHLRTLSATGDSHVEHDEAEARLGVAIGLAFPRTSSLRARAMLGFDLSPTRLTDPDAGNGDVPQLPRWAISGTIALDYDVL